MMNTSRWSTVNTDIGNVLECAILAASCAAVAWFARWCYKDIAREKRPEVTDDMIQEAFERDVMSDFDTEFDKVDWED